ncbi:MAG: nucleotidyltransferase domain-containing protein, partial [Microcystis sp.]
MKKLEKIITEFRQALEKIYGDKLINLVLYGSQARGDATEDSDIDIMVVLKSPVSPGDEIFQMGEVKNQINLKYDQLISVLPISE